MALNTPGRNLLEHAVLFKEDEDIRLARKRIQQAIALEPGQCHCHHHYHHGAGNESAAWR